jgi:hypothetical protein
MRAWVMAMVSAAAGAASRAATAQALSRVLRSSAGSFAGLAQLEVGDRLIGRVERSKLRPPSMKT